jgi:alpha-tubulin suppressor-like RCC1 family protein
VNDFGRVSGLSHDTLTYVSKTACYQSYQPTTLVPSYYNREPNNPGFIVGRFRNSDPNIEFTTDFSSIFFHEFGHTLNMVHNHYTNENDGGTALKDVVNWYGLPHPAGGAAPAQPAQNSAGTPTFGLPSRYYGGGTCAIDPVSGACEDDAKPSTYKPWVGDLKALHPASLSHITNNTGAQTRSADDNGGLAGIPGIGTATFNSRVVFPADIAPGRVPRYAWNYPNVFGAIRLQRGTEAYVTTNWYDATSKAQFDVATQSNPFFVTSIFPKARARQVVVASNGFSSSIRGDGSVFAWGFNQNGNLGRGTSGGNAPTPAKITATDVPSSNTFVSVDSGNCHELAIATDGRLFGWGCDLGRLGGGNNASLMIPFPALVCGNNTQECFANRYTSVAAGGDFSVALASDGSLWSFGANWTGQLGDNTVQDHYFPTRVDTSNVGSSNAWIAVDAADRHALGITADGRLWAWGNNDFGQLGLGSTGTSRLRPTQVGTATDWVSVAAGTFHTVAIKADGSLWAWGLNDQRQINGAGGTVSAPVRIGTATDWTVVSAGYCHSVALKRNGTAYAWGCNDGGQLGTNNVTPSASPTRVCNDSSKGCFSNHYVAVSSGAGHSVALKDDGTVWSWGDNSHGELGTGNTTRSLLPISSNAGSSALIGAVTTSVPSTIDLTNEGKMDWVHFDTTTLASVRRKNLGAGEDTAVNDSARIRDVARIASGSASVLTSGVASGKWTLDGPTTTHSGTSTRAVAISTLNDGLKFTVLGGTTARTLKVYVSVEKATGQFSASVSDGSSPSYTNNIANSSGTTNAVYTVNFNGKAAKTDLSVSWKMTSQSSGGRIKIVGITLQ